MFDTPGALMVMVQDAQERLLGRWGVEGDRTSEEVVLPAEVVMAKEVVNPPPQVAPTETAIGGQGSQSRQRDIPAEQPEGQTKPKSKKRSKTKAKKSVKPLTAAEAKAQKAESKRIAEQEAVEAEQVAQTSVIHTLQDVLKKSPVVKKQQDGDFYSSKFTRGRFGFFRGPPERGIAAARDHLYTSQRVCISGVANWG
jgi:hypothetical protein